ncbi:MAG: FecR family protein [Pseudomonadota bacterium]
MNPLLQWACALLLAGFTLASAHASEAVIGYVKSVNGEAYVVANGRAEPARIGSPVSQGHLLRTGKTGSLGVTFKDNTVMSFGPDTELTLDEYLYAPSQGQLKFGSTLSRGTLNYVSGVIAKLKPEAVKVRTPTGTIGVRGTQFLAKVTP